MSGSVEIVVWLHEYQFKALEHQLAMDGSDIEKTMQELLMDLYSRCVPLEERQAIQERIDTEHAEQAAEQLASTTWAAYHITTHSANRISPQISGGTDCWINWMARRSHQTRRPWHCPEADGFLWRKSPSRMR